MALCDALLLPQDDLTLRLPADQPARRPDRRQPDAAGDRPRAARCGTRCAIAPTEQDDWRAAWTFFAALLARVDYAQPARAALRSARAARRSGAAVRAARCRRPPSRWTNCCSAALAYARTHPPSLQGFLHWLRPLRRRGEARAGRGGRRGAHHDRARRQGAAGAAGHPARHHRAAAGRGHRCCGPTTPAPRRAVPIWSPRQELRCAAAQRPARRGRRAAHGGAQPAAVCRADAGRGPAGGVRLADRAARWPTPAGIGWSSAASSAGCGDRQAANASRFRWLAVMRCATETPQTVPAGGAGDLRSPTPPGRPAAVLGRPRAGLAAAPPPAEPPCPNRWRPAGRRAWSSARCRRAPRRWPSARGAVDRFRRGQLAARAAAAPAGAAGRRHAGGGAYLARPARPRACRRRGRARWPRRCWRSSTHPDLAPLFGPASRAEVPLTGAGRRHGDRRAGRSAGGAGRSRAAGRLQDQPRGRRQTEADTPVLYLRQLAAYRAVLRQIFPDRPVQCALVWTQAARVSILPDALLDSACSQRDPPARPHRRSRPT